MREHPGDCSPDKFPWFADRRPGTIANPDSLQLDAEEPRGCNWIVTPPQLRALLWLDHYNFKPLGLDSFLPVICLDNGLWMLYDFTFGEGLLWIIWREGDDYGCRVTTPEECSDIMSLAFHSMPGIFGFQPPPVEPFHEPDLETEWHY